jgi:histidine triad (HIT) family protein
MACVFCEIVAGKAPAHRVGENARALAILDIYPWSKGHTLVLSKRHVPSWQELSEREAADLFALTHRVGRRLSKVFNPEFVYLMARGRRIPHTHVFVVPTHPGDLLDRHFSSLGGIQEGAPELAALREHASRSHAARRIGRLRKAGSGKRNVSQRSRRTRKP